MIDPDGLWRSGTPARNVSGTCGRLSDISWIAVKALVQMHAMPTPWSMKLVDHDLPHAVFV
jgi:hypothetical protein